MGDTRTQVDYLKQITVSLEYGTSPENMDLSQEPHRFQFIYGVGTEGLCLFEKALFEKQPGQEVLLQVEPGQVDAIFGHLKQSLMNDLPLTSPFFLKSTLESIEKVEDREIIQAIANGIASGGCDCGCGCGC